MSDEQHWDPDLQALDSSGASWQTLEHGKDGPWPLAEAKPSDPVAALAARAFASAVRCGGCDKDERHSAAFLSALAEQGYVLVNAEGLAAALPPHMQYDFSADDIDARRMIAAAILAAIKEPRSR